MSADPSVQSKRLKAVNKLISHQSEEQPGTSSQNFPVEEEDEVNQAPQRRKGMFSQLSLSKCFKMYLNLKTGKHFL